MQIAGLQKLTLLDFPGKIACTVFLHGCQFRCPFCHNAPLVTEPLTPEMSVDACLQFLEKRQGILEGVCITGGEPTLQPELPAFLRQIKDLGYDIKLDTNGYRPQILRDLVAQKLVDYVAMDIKNAPARYAETVGLSNFDMSKIEESVEFLKSNAVSYEFRTTLVKEFHTTESMLSLAQWLQGDMPYFLQNFVDSGALIGHNLHGFTPEEMSHLAQSIRPFLPKVEIRGI